MAKYLEPRNQMKDIIQNDFTAEVIERSKVVPVLVDFWAPWCGPCKVLGPILEKLEKEGNGQWILAKVNTDDFPELGAAYKVRGIPAVKLFNNGAIIAEFTGALPEGQLRAWLKKNIPDGRLAAWEKIIADSVFPPAANVLEKACEFVDVNPDMEVAVRYVAFAEALAGNGALKRLENLERNANWVEFREQLENLEDFMQGVEAGKNPKTNELEMHIRNALRSGKLDKGMEQMVDLLMIEKDFPHAKTAGIAIFSFLGREHPLSLQYRRRFDMALY